MGPESHEFGSFWTIIDTHKLRNHRKITVKAHDVLGNSCCVNKIEWVSQVVFELTFFKEENQKQVRFTEVPGPLPDIEKFVKSYSGGRKIPFIPSISEIQSQMWYHYVQYTRRHFMSPISH